MALAVNGTQLKDLRNSSIIQRLTSILSSTRHTQLQAS